MTRFAPQSNLLSRSISVSRLMGLGQGLPEFTEPSGEMSPPGDKGATALAPLLRIKGEPGKGGEAQSGLKAPAVEPPEGL